MNVIAGQSTANARTHEPCQVTVFRTLADDCLLRRIRAEYRGMPAMRLTLDQAMRLWMLDRETCARMLNLLIEARFIDRDASGRYRKAQRTTA